MRISKPPSKSRPDGPFYLRSGRGSTIYVRCLSERRKSDYKNRKAGWDIYGRREIATSPFRRANRAILCVSTYQKCRNICRDGAYSASCSTEQTRYIINVAYAAFIKSKSAFSGVWDPLTNERSMHALETDTLQNFRHSFRRLTEPIISRWFLSPGIKIKEFLQLESAFTKNDFTSIQRVQQRFACKRSEREQQSFEILIMFSFVEEKLLYAQTKSSICLTFCFRISVRRFH